LVWFVIPDAWVLAACAARPAQARRIATLAWCFSALGIVVAMGLCSFYPGSMTKMVYSLPFTYPEMGDWIGDHSKEWGVWLALYQPSSNAPAKVWIIESVTKLPWSPLFFFSLLVFARGVRMSLAAVVGWLVGTKCGKVLRAAPALCLLVHSSVVVGGIWATSHSFLND
jgi:hypothetical protein